MSLALVLIRITAIRPRGDDSQQLVVSSTLRGCIHDELAIQLPT